MSVTVKIEGLEELKRSLQILPVNIQKNILTSGVRAVASTFQKAAKKNVHVDSGDLKKSIIVKKRRTKSKTHIKYTVGIDKNKFGVFYGSMVEFGTSKMSAKPFMSPAFEQNKSKAIEMMTSKIRQRLDKEVVKSRAR